MTTTLRFSTSLVSALLVMSMALHASAEEPPDPARDDEPRKHAVSVTFGLTPLYFGEAVGFTDGGGDYYSTADEPLLVGLSGDYMRRYGVVRLGFGLRYSHTWDTSSKRRDWRSFVHELGATGLLSLGGTTKSGVDIAATIGLGIGHSWVPNFDLYPPSFGVIGELLAAVAIPVRRDADFFLSSGLRLAFYTGNLNEGEAYRRPNAFMARAYFPLELGFRKRF